MPTTRPRYQVTETETVGHALDAAAEEWPDEPRSKLLLRLIALGEQALQHGRSEQVLARRIAIQETSGKYDGVFGENYLAELRDDWPA